MSELLAHPIIAAIILLGLLVFIHELGHFLVGIWCGAGVEIFSIGFGPALAHFKARGIEYRIGVVPLGGFVKFAGSTEYEEVPAQWRGREFFRLSKMRRLIIIAAGPLANLLLAVTVYAALGLKGIPHSPAVIGLVRADSPAQKSGLLSGDRIVEVNDAPTLTFDDVRQHISKSAGKEINLIVDRAGQRLNLRVLPESVAGDDEFGASGEQGRIGIGVGFRQPVIGISDPDSLAAGLGLQSGDLVTSLESGGQAFPVRDDDEMRRRLAGLVEAGNDFVIHLKRSPTDPAEKSGKEIAVPVTAAWLARHGPVTALSQTQGLLPSGELVIKSPTGTDPNLSATDAGGLRAGDRLLALNGEPLKDIFSLSGALGAVSDPNAVFSVMREGKTVEVNAVLEPYEIQKPAGKATHYKISPDFFASLESPVPYVEKYDGPLSALAYGLKETARQSTMLVSVLGGLVTGNVPLKVLGGPVMIAKFAGEAARAGIEVFASMMALISVNLAVVNLVPIPVLDGGQMTLIGLEALKGRRLERKAIENFQKLGFVAVLFLMIIATYNDFSRFWSEMLRGLKGIF